MKHNSAIGEKGIRYPIILAVLLAVIVSAIVLGTHDITFTTTDDAYMLQTLAGYYTDRPMEWIPFLGPVLAKCIGLLYRLSAGIPWYTHLQHFLIVASMAIINYSLLKHTRLYARWLSVLVGVISCAMVDTALSWMLVRMHFYYASVLAGTAAVALLLTPATRKAGVVIHTILCGILFLFCINYSIDVCYCVCCYLFLAIWYGFLMEIDADKSRIKKQFIRAMAFSAAIVLLVVSSLFFFRAERDRLCGTEYTEWNKKRISYWDYDVKTYEETPELYESIGWTQEFYDLTDKMYFMDERFGSEELTQIVNSFDRLGFTSGTRSFAAALNTCAELLGSDKEAHAIVWLMAGLVAATLIIAVTQFRNRRQRIRALASLCCFGGSLVLILYLSFRGRFPLRAFVTISIPCIAFMGINLVEMVSHVGESAEREAKRGKWSFSERAGAVILSLVLCLSYSQYLIYNHSFLHSGGMNRYYEREKAKEDTIYQYAMEHPENIYVYDWTSIAVYDPYPALKVGDLSNLFCWGGARLYTYPYNVQLGVNGLEKLSSEEFGRDGVYLLSNSDDSIHLLYRYLYNTFGYDQCFIVDKLGMGFKVIKFADSRDEGFDHSPGYSAVSKIWIY